LGTLPVRRNTHYLCPLPYWVKRERDLIRTVERIGARSGGVELQMVWYPPLGGIENLRTLLTTWADKDEEKLCPWVSVSADQSIKEIHEQ
jgi:hypothetical protein